MSKFAILRPNNHRFASRAATPGERSRVQQFNTLTRHQTKGTVTGVIVDDLPDFIWVRLYGAGCLHDAYPIRRNTIVEVKDDPR